MSEKDDDLLMEGAKRLRQLIQDKNSKASERAQSSEASRTTTTKWAQTSSAASTSSISVDLNQATMEQLLDEIKARYTAVNLKADIKISIQPIEGGFVMHDEAGK